ncbi:ATP-binding protein [Granulicella sp. S190]|uniref:PAS domain-containing sensor histidine kinase n=1 Tax=Granulicella sp. S190 TaxID=1747226 RepID=UPI00131DE942|nr:ATP-binding protein [Granulicella sp. S190]
MTQQILQNVGQMHHWQALLDSAGEGIWGLDLEGNCTFVNRMAVKSFGFASEEMLGSNMHELIHHHYPDGRHFPGEECPIYDVLRKSKALRQLTDTMFRKDGSSFVAELSAQPVIVEGNVIGVVVTFREVTEVRQQQENLRKAYELAEQKTAELDAVIESMPHGVYIATRDTKLRSNHVAKMMTDGKFPHELKTLDTALAGEWSTETVRTSDRWIRSVAAPIFLNGKILGGVAVNTDVTQARLQDEALRKSEKLAAVGQLASSIAHEINNPLESITNLLYLIRQSESKDEMQHYAELAQGELARVTEITLQTLRFNRQHSKPIEVNMSELLRTVMALYTGRILVRNIEIDLKLRETPTVKVLEGEIRQVINNLVRNALDAMSGGGRLKIRLHSQRDSHSDCRGVRLTVADTGEGIRPEIQEHLFEAFQTTKELTGTGLGLWVSKGIVEKHGGRIRVRTRRGEGHGTVFCVWLPVDGHFNPLAQGD